jgi:hypothetical protein
MPDLQETKFLWTTVAWMGVALFSLAWWAVAAQHSLWRFVLTIALSSASFMIGCLIGFLFTSYGEETNTVGKVREWLIGGLTGLTIAKACRKRAMTGTSALQSPHQCAQKNKRTGEPFSDASVGGFGPRYWVTCKGGAGWPTRASWLRFFWSWIRKNGGVKPEI